MYSIAVVCNYLTEELKALLDKAAQENGCSLHYYPDETAFAPHAEEHEILYGHISPALLSRMSKLKWLYSDFAGVEKYLPDPVWPHPGCLLSNASGAYGPAISEHILMVVLMLFKRLPDYLPDLEKRKWSFYSPIRSITGSHFVLLGTGDIGRNTARRLKALGAAVTGVCRSGRSSDSSFDEVWPVERLDGILPQADGLILSLPATKETAGILSRERIALLPPRAIVVNVGRGSAIDQEALAKALMDRRIAGAALDVATPEPLPEDHPLWRCPNTIITPHISGNMSLGLTCALVVGMFCRDLPRFLRGEPMETLVDRIKGY